MSIDIREQADEAWGAPADDHRSRGRTRPDFGKVDGRNAAHIMTVLRCAPAWEDVLAYDEFGQRVVIRREIPRPDGVATQPDSVPRELCDVDVTRGLEWFHARGMVALRERLLFNLMIAAARESSFHPVRDFFVGVMAGGTPANVPSMLNAGKINHDLPDAGVLALLLTLGFGAEDTRLNRAIGRAFMIAMVRRVRNPGCQHDHMPIFIGAQGIGKSTGLRALIGSEWFADNMPDLGSKDAMLQLRGKLLIEWAEMTAASRSRSDRIKAFISSPADTYRPPYERAARTVPRSCSFAGTCNTGDFLDDPTGGRRFWPVECTQVDRDWIAKNRRLLWRLACEAEALGEQSWITGLDLQAEIIERQGEAQREEPWQTIILDRARPGLILTNFVADVIGIPLADQTNGHLQRVANVLKKAGWHKARPREGTGRSRRWYPAESGE